MNQEAWNKFVQQNTYAMTYYLLKSGTQFVCAGWRLSNRSLTAKTFLSETAANKWANLHAPIGANWEVEKREL
jgi:hypothetical protein